jgi:hypothetical protein
MALVWSVLRRLLYCNETVRNAPKHEFWVHWSGSGAFVAKIFRCDFVYRTCALMAPVRPVLHRLSCSNETIRNAPKHEFWVQWIGSGAFIAKKANTNSFCELVH